MGLAKFYKPVLLVTSPDLLCPSGMNCYAHVSSSSNYKYKAAEAMCYSLGGHLVNIETANEYNPILTWLQGKGERWS